MMQDPFTDRLSEFLDGGLDPGERAAVAAHLETCAACRDELLALQSLVGAAGALGERAPPRDLWPGIAARIGAAPRPRRAALRAAALLLAGGILGALAVLWGGGADGPPGGGERFLLVLHQPPGMAREGDPAARVERYRNWARGLAALGQLEAGEKLASGEGLLLRPGAAPAQHRPDGPRGEIGGFFLLRATSYEHAVRLLADCPHLQSGGWIELRRIEKT